MTRYRTIVADPPWSPNSNGKANPRKHYDVMTTDAICQIPVGEMAADDSYLWCWVINAMVEDGYRVVRSWGFTPISLLTWCKPQPGVGVYVRNNTEHAVLARRGRPPVPSAAASATWYRWPRAEHSRKPDAFFDLVESLCPEPRIELFSRRARFGWDTWGNESLHGGEAA